MLRGNVTCQKVRSGFAPRSPGRLQQAPVEPIEREEDRHDHVGQVDVDQGQDHGELVEEEGLDRSLHELRARGGCGSTMPLMPEDGKPAHRPDQVARPERHHHEDQERRLVPPRRPREEVGEGIADQDADAGHRDGHPDRPREQVREHRILHEVEVVAPREVGNRCRTSSSDRTTSRRACRAG